MNTQTGALKINGTEGTAGQILTPGGTGAPAWITPVKYIPNPNNPNINFSLANNGDEATISSVTVTLTQNSFVEVYGTVGLNAFSNSSIYLLLDTPYGNMIVAANPGVLGITTMGFVYRSPIAFSPGSHVYTLKVKKIIGGLVVSSSGYTNPYGSADGKITAKIINDGSDCGINMNSYGFIRGHFSKLGHYFDDVIQAANDLRNQNFTLERSNSRVEVIDQPFYTIEVFFPQHRSSNPTQHLQAC